MSGKAGPFGANRPLPDLVRAQQGRSTESSQRRPVSPRKRKAHSSALDAQAFLDESRSLSSPRFGRQERRPGGQRRQELMPRLRRIVAWLGFEADFAPAAPGNAASGKSTARASAAHRRRVGPGRNAEPKAAGPGLGTIPSRPVGASALPGAFASKTERRFHECSRIFVGWLRTGRKFAYPQKEDSSTKHCKVLLFQTWGVAINLRCFSEDFSIANWGFPKGWTGSSARKS